MQSRSEEILPLLSFFTTLTSTFFFGMGLPSSSSSTSSSAASPSSPSAGSSSFGGSSSFADSLAVSA
jgi:hypothetical protein